MSSKPRRGLVRPPRATGVNDDMGVSTLGNGFHLGRVAGVEIVVDWSLSIIFLLIAFSLAIVVFPAWHPRWGAAQNWLTALAAGLLFCASVLAHELSHAIAGRAHGIGVRRITLFVFGGMAQMDSEPRSWRAELLVAIVGPVTSLVLGLVFIVLGGAVAGTLSIDSANPAAAMARLNPLATLLLWLGPINIILGVFNLVPGFPLDGGRVLRALLWAGTGDLYRATRWAARSGQIFAWLLIGTGLAMAFGARVPFIGGGFVNGLWLGFIGWFLNNAALLRYRQLLTQELLDTVAVERLMRTQLTRIEPGTPLDTLIQDYVVASGQRVFPVVDDCRLVGMVHLRDLREVARERWPGTRAVDVMTPRAALTTVTPRTGSARAMELLARRDVEQLAVVDGDRLVGLVGGEDILKWLAPHEGKSADQTEHAAPAAHG